MSRRLTKYEFIQRAINIHDDRYDYSLVEYLGFDKKIKLICNKCNAVFEPTPHNHLKGSGCLNCANIDKTKTLEQFIEDANLVHKELYDYSKSKYKNVETKLFIIHKKCGLPFWQTPHCHLSGRGCPSCIKSESISNAETEWLNLLSIPVEYRQKRIKMGGKKFLVDAYDPSTNTIYEYFGDFWHGNIQNKNPNEINPRTGTSYGYLYKETTKRVNAIKSAGYNLIHIWESDWLAQKKEMAKNAEK